MAAGPSQDAVATVAPEDDLGAAVADLAASLDAAARAALDAAAILDARGLTCPLPVLKARRALARLDAGAALVVAATDPMAAIDLPHLCTTDGHRLVAMQRGERLSLYVIAARG